MLVRNVNIHMINLFQMSMSKSIHTTTTSTLDYNFGDMVYLSHDNKFNQIINCNPSINPYPKLSEKSEYYTRKYNRHNMVCWVITIDPLSFLPINDELKHRFIKVALEVLTFTEQLEFDQNVLTVFQYAPHTGLHIHLCYITKDILEKPALDEITAHLNGKYKFDGKDYELTASYQKIKSPASYLYYLQSSHKGTFLYAASNFEIAMLLCSFDKNIIFGNTSTSKKQKILDDGTRIVSDNSLVLFFMRKLNEGVQTYDMVLKDPNIQLYLHLINLKSTWENCVSQFKATLTHEKNLIHILQLVNNLTKEEFCACPVIDLLIYQNIQPYEFGESLIVWLFGNNETQKRNTLLLEGPPDTGKSYLARELWQLFYMHERIINDGLFSFAPAPGAGCLLWEETHISPELAEMTKLIMEGNPTVSVAVKNKPSQRLNKRIPLIVTNNKAMGVYCTNDQPAFDARCFKFNFKYPIHYLNVCTNNVHYCPNIDIKHNEHNIVQQNSSPSAEREENAKNCVTNCLKFHKLTRNSLLSYIGFALRKHGYKILENNPDIKEKIKKIQLYAGTNCCTSTLLNYD